MDIDTAKIDEAVLALLYLGRHDGDLMDNGTAIVEASIIPRI